MNYIETEFLKTQSMKPCGVETIIDDVFFYLDGEENLEILKRAQWFSPQY